MTTRKLSALPVPPLLAQLVLPAAIARWLPLFLHGQSLEDAVVAGLLPVAGAIVAVLLVSGLCLFPSPRRGLAGQTAHGLLGLAIGTALFHVTIILFGAPVNELCTQTVLLALLTSSCTALPLALHFGCRPHKWLDLLLQLRPSDAQELYLVCSVLGATLGVYVGALPIPLDWDRPWQQWPLTCVYGMLMGHAAGILVSLGISATSLAGKATKED